LAVQKICRHLQDEGQLSNAALAPLLKAAVLRLAGKPIGERAPSATTTLVTAHKLPLAQQPMRTVLAAYGTTSKRRSVISRRF